MATDTSLNHEQKGLSDFLASHGGPFYELQARLNLLQARSTRKLSSMLASRTAIVPVAAAALLPFAIAGTIWLPLKEVGSLLKKLLLL